MASRNEVNVVIDLSAEDNTGAGVKSAQERLRKIDQAALRTQQSVRRMMRQEYNLTLRAIDQVTPAAGRIRSALRGLAGRAHIVSVRLNDRVTAPLMRLRGVASGIGSRISGAFSSVMGVGAGMMAGAGILYGINDTINTFKNFEKTMSQVKSISQASGAEFVQLKDKALELGKKTKYSIQEIAQAMTYTGMAGWSAKETVAGLEGIVNLAAAGNENLARTSDIVTDALTAFGLSADKSSMFADAMAATITKSNTTIDLMGYTFKQVAPLAGALKYDFRDINVAAGLMANAGIKGETAGMALKHVISSLANPTKTSAAWIDKWGLSFYDAQGKARPFLEVLADVKKQFDAMSAQEQAAAGKDIGGLYGMAGFLALMNADAAKVAELRDAVYNSQGLAARIADENMNNLAGDMEKLSAAWAVFQYEIVNGKASGLLRDIINGVREDVEKLTDAIRDGLDFGDIAQLLGNVLRQLFGQFRKLDGVGSALAGGALLFGLHRLYTVITAIGAKLAFIIRGSGAAAVVAGAQATQAAQQAATQAAIANPATSAATLGGRIRGGMKRNLRASGAAMLLNAGVAGLSAYSAWKEAAAADKEYQDALAQQNIDPNKLAELKQRKEQAQMNQRAAIGGGIGMVAGGAIGAMVGGPFGAMIGGQLGSMAGEALAENWDAIAEHLKGVAEGIGGAFSACGAVVSAAFEGAKDTALQLWSDAGDWFASNVAGPISATFNSACEAISGAFSTAYDAVTGIWSAAAGWFDSNVAAPIRNAIATVADAISGSPSTASVTTYESAVPRAAGGIFGSPTYSLIGEAGPEAVIPLSPSRRSRGLDLLGRSASAMGVKFGDTRPLAAQGMSVGVSVGGVTFNVDGASPDIMGEISAHIEDITDDIAGKLAEKLSAIHGNQARMAA